MYDAIVVGARCAGSPTAMLLVRQGLRVLLLDRASFPSDALSAHYIHQPGVTHLQRWGLLDRVAASNCPVLRQQTFDVGPFQLMGTPPPADGVAVSYAPRRTVLDQILVEAAATDGAEVRERFSVSELVMDGERVTGVRGHTAGGATVTEQARIVVVGADGLYSLVARGVQAPIYNARPALTCAYYSYWSDVAVERPQLHPRPDRMILSAPTNDGQTLVIIYWPQAQFHVVRADIEGHFMTALDLVPDLAEQVRKGSRTERFRGTADLRNFYRPYGPGWALVGDAGYHKDPITAQGISDAFRDAELVAGAITDGFAGRRPLADGLAAYEQRRNEATLPMYELTCQFAALQPPPEMQALFAALRDDQDQTDQFFGTVAGTVPIPDFFAPENLGRIINGAQSAAA